MIKRFRKGLKRQYRLVKKFSTMLEARLAQEVLNAYHVRTFVVHSYHRAQVRLQESVEEIQLLVLPQDYQFAHRLLYATN